MSITHSARTALFLIALAAPAAAQSTVSGVWRVEGSGDAFPWTLVLRTDSATLTGNVTSCASNRGAIIEVSDGRVEGNVIAFTCVSNNGGRTLTFTGTVEGDALTLTWVKHVQPGAGSNARDAALFGDDVPSRFVARRVPDNVILEFERNQIDALDYVRGLEIAAAVNLIEQDVRIVGTLFIPRSVETLRTVIVVIDRGLGWNFYDDRPARQLAERTGAGLLLARLSNIRVGPAAELASVPLLF